jgi:hypothetical protein
MFENSFTWWLVNFMISAAWFAGSVMTGNYFLALGSLFYLAAMMIVDLPGASSEEGSADPLNESPDDGISDSIPNL